MKLPIPLILVSLIILVTLGAIEVMAQDEIVYISAGKRDNQADYIYCNETNIELNVLFSVNCTMWSVDMIGYPLFTSDVYGIHIDDQMTGGRLYSTRLIVNGSAQVGPYNLTVYVNYTNEDGMPINNSYNMTIDHQKAIEVQEYSPPTGQGRTFSIDLVSYVNIKEIQVDFFPSGDIVTQPENITLSDVKPGKHRIATTIKIIPAPDSHRSISFYIQCSINNRVIVLSISDIPLNLSREEEVDNTPEAPSDSPEYTVILLMVIGLLVFNILFYLFILPSRKNE